MEQLCVNIKMILLVLIGMIGLLYLLVPHDTYKKFRVVIVVLLAIAAATSFGTYIRFGDFLHGKQLHHHDVSHYYFGAKYASEFGYFNIYRCICIADYELLKDSDRTMSEHMQNFKIRQLEDYSLRPLKDIVTNPVDIEKCKSKFSAKRWKQFKQDVADYYKVQNHYNLYDRCGDRGYHGTPVWGVYAGALANLLPVDSGWLIAASWLDILILSLGFLVLGIAFGAEIGLIAITFYFAIFFNHPHYIHFSFLRYDWAGVVMMAIAMLKLKRYKLSGALFAFAAVIRLFPLLLMFGLAVKIIRDILLHRKVQKKYLHFAIAYLATLIVTISLSVMVYGVDYYGEYLNKLKVHSELMTISRIGLPYMMILYDGETLTSAVKNIVGDEAAISLKQQVSVDTQRIIIGGVLLLSMLVFLVFASLKLKDYEATSLAYALTFLLLGMTLYYGVLIVILVPLFLSKRMPYAGAALWGLLILSMLMVYFISQTWFEGAEINRYNSLLLFVLLSTTAIIYALKDTFLDTKLSAFIEGIQMAVIKKKRQAVIASVFIVFLIAAVLLGLWFSESTPNKEDWERAFLAVKENGFDTKNDVIAISPYDAHFEQAETFTGNIFYMNKPESYGFWKWKRVWILSEPGKFHEKAYSVRPYQVALSKISKDSIWQKAIKLVLLDFKTPMKSRFNLLENLEQADVWTQSGEDKKYCDLNTSGRFVCENNSWSYVGEDSQEFLGFKRKNIWSHPTKGVLHIRYPDVELGERIQLETGLSDFAVELENGAVVWIDVFVSGEKIARIVQKNIAGWHLHSIDTKKYKGERVDLDLQINTRNPGRRHFMFNGDILVPVK